MTTPHPARLGVSLSYRQSRGLDRVEKEFYGDVLGLSLIDMRTIGSPDFDLSIRCDGTKPAERPMKTRNHDELHLREQLGLKGEGGRRNEISNLTDGGRGKRVVVS